MQVVLRFAQPFGSAQSRPKPDGTQDTTAYEGQAQISPSKTMQKRVYESSSIMVHEPEGDWPRSKERKR
jgi:hypothetical protein